MSVLGSLSPLTPLVLDWLDLDQEIKEKQDDKAKVGLMLMRELTSGGEVRMPSGMGIKMMAPVQRFDPALAKTVLPPDLLEAISVTEPSAKMAADILPPALLALCRRSTGDPFLRRL